MPSINHRAIVSASGYTKPAIRKANFHKVELFELMPWSNTMEAFEHIKFSPDLPILENRLKWLDNPQIHFNPEEDVPNDIVKLISQNPRICDFQGNDMPECKNVRGLVNNLLSKALNEILRHESIQLLSVGQSKNVVIIMNINDQPHIDIDNKESRYLLSQAIIKGQVILSDDKKLKPEFKVLVKYGEKDPYVGCIITELTVGNLIGFTISQYDKKLSLIQIPISARNKKKIYRQKLK